MSIELYEKPNLTTDMVLFRVNESENKDKRRNSDKELQVLLINRDKTPDKGLLSLPGGFVDITEGIYDNVRRKLTTKTGIVGDFYVEQLYTWGGLNRDSRGRIISVSYVGLCNEETYKETNKNLDYVWLNVYEVLAGVYGKLAFDHQEIIEYALNRLVNKVEYTDIVFNLLPTEFTVGECKAVYELILQREVLNFKRKISEYIQPLNKLRKIEGKQFRPAELYTLKKNRTSKF